MPQPRRLLFVRHGEADYDGVLAWGATFTGARRDLAPLTARGREQARAAGRQIATLRDDGRAALHVVASPYTRTLQTAVAIGHVLGVDVDVAPGLHDWLPVRDGGAAITAEIVAEKTREFMAAAASGVVPSERSWETFDEVRARVIASLRRQPRADVLIVVTHEAIVQACTGIADVPVGSVHAIETAQLLD